jgi:hypothetical protein
MAVPKQIARRRRQKVAESEGQVPSFFGFHQSCCRGGGLAIFPLLGLADVNINYPKLGKYFSFCRGGCKFERAGLLPPEPRFGLYTFENTVINL